MTTLKLCYQEIRVRRSRQCCNGSKFAVPLLDAMVSTWSSCVELWIQQLFIGLSAHKGL